MPTPLHKLPSPPSRESITDTSHVVRERRFPASHDLHAILKQLQSTHSTGTLFIDLSQGGIGSIRFREEHRVDFEK